MTEPGPTIGVAASVRDRVTRDVARGQMSFAVFIAVCVALHPGLVLKVNEGGMSNYGVHLKTVVPYTLALALASAFSFRASQVIGRARPEARYFRCLLRAYGGLILLTLITTYPYTLNPSFKDLHIGVGVAITLFEVVASLWLHRVVRALPLVLVAVIVGFVLSVLTFFGVVHVLFLTQVLVGGGFALLLVRTSRHVA